jgi:hypothetical protein
MGIPPTEPAQGISQSEKKFNHGDAALTLLITTNSRIKVFAN